MSDPNVPPPQTPPPTMDYQTPPSNGGMFSPPPVPMYPVPVPERTMGMLCHLLALAGLLAIPFANIIGPLVIWLIKKDQSPFANDQGKESINFQITATIVALLCVPLFCIGIGIIIVPAVGIIALVFSVIGAMQANNGVWYRYPFSLRLLK